MYSSESSWHLKGPQVESSLWLPLTTRLSKAVLAENQTSELEKSHKSERSKIEYRELHSLSRTPSTTKHDFESVIENVKLTEIFILNSLKILAATIETNELKLRVTISATNSSCVRLLTHPNIH